VVGKKDNKGDRDLRTVEVNSTLKSGGGTPPLLRDPGGRLGKKKAKVVCRAREE